LSYREWTHARISAPDARRVFGQPAPPWIHGFNLFSSL
jgi:hypothetical protein